MELMDIKGIGPAILKKLERLSILTVNDLLSHYPSRYIDRRKNFKIVDLKLVEDENYHCIGRVRTIKKLYLPRKREMTTAVFEDDTDAIQVTWFNNPYISNQIKAGDEIVFSGQVTKGKLTNPKVKKISCEEDITIFSQISPIYPETKGLRSYQLNIFIADALLKMESNGLKEILTTKILQKEGLITKIQALFFIHKPLSTEQIEQARSRLGFEEIYNILKQVKKRKKYLSKYKSPELRINLTTQEELRTKLAFTLTDSQNIAIDEIFNDLTKSRPMYRLLNGDVGSGKTVVAASCIWQCINNGLQAVLLAPTAVLARQHYDTFRNLLKDFKIDIFLETSDTRKELNIKRQNNDINSINNQILIGTHALLHRLDLLNNVGLVVIDEQHKFGVKQRELLENLSNESNSTKLVPHVLSMSATPIPRSLALTLFGDIDVSFLEKPLDRKNIVTKVITDHDLIERMYEWIRDEIKQNSAQVYIVCPLIEDSPALEAKSVKQEYERVKKIFPELKATMLHGKMKTIEKDNIVQEFKKGLTDILVTTSVIEVGIDNPNATIMIVEGAERFGLAQLHQIRGRVGRSDKQSYCFFIPTGGIEVERLNLFAGTTDGFKVAEYDLQSRGPGEVYGNLQSGIPDLKIANIMDLDLIKRVRQYI